MQEQKATAKQVSAVHAQVQVEGCFYVGRQDWHGQEIKNRSVAKLERDVAEYSPFFAGVWAALRMADVKVTVVLFSIFNRLLYLLFQEEKWPVLRSRQIPTT